MNRDEIPTSFDELAVEHNLSTRLRDLCRIFFKAGLAIGRRQAAAVAEAHQVVGRPYHPALDRDTAPGEFR